MGKVVINACYGGFGLSKEACQRYWDLKGEQVWIENDMEFSSLLFTIWLVSPKERIKKKNWNSMSQDERIAYNKAYSEQTWNARKVERHDPILVQVVEELGDKASGEFSKLQVVEVDGHYRINEYDGYESVETPYQIDWQFA